LASDRWGLLFAASQPGYGLRTLITLAIEVAAVLPFGIFIARNARRRSHPETNDGRMTQLTLQLIISGLLLGIGIETLQLFTYSGSSQGVSVITRTLGVYIGGMLWVTMGGKNALAVA
jgi:glycopeptide antibiotics resistance protein